MKLKVIAGLGVFIVILSLILYNLHEKVKVITKENEQLKTSLEANIEAVKNKEERNKNEISTLQKNLESVSKVDCSYSGSLVDDSVVIVLQKLNKDYSDSISLIIAEQSRMCHNNQ